MLALATASLSRAQKQFEARAHGSHVERTLRCVDRRWWMLLCQKKFTEFLGVQTDRKSVV